MFRIIKLIIWIVVIFLGITYYNYSQFDEEIVIKNPTVFEVGSGENLKSLSKKLGVSYYFLKKYVDDNNTEFELKVGKYQIGENSNILDVLVSLEKPITDEINVTVLEGWNIFDTDDYLSSLGVINEGEYISYAENKEKIAALTEFFPFLEGLNTLEGYLYPDTYKIDTAKFGINTFVINQLENFEDKVYNKILSSYDNKTVNEIINLSSIVEKEANQKDSSEEVAIVAGILKKRLNEGWYIGADATVCYPFRITHKECSPTFINTNINKQNDYNLRINLGLPPTPIGNPNYKTIYATINDIETKYYFYLHDNTGQIHYAETNSGHVNNKNKYLR